jgi:hypothetical protein
LGRSAGEVKDPNPEKQRAIEPVEYLLALPENVEMARIPENPT